MKYWKKAINYGNLPLLYRFIKGIDFFLFKFFILPLESLKLIIHLELPDR